MGMSVGVDVDIVATLIFRRALCYGTSALVPLDASMSFSLVELIGIIDCWMW